MAAAPRFRFPRVPFHENAGKKTIVPISDYACAEMHKLLQGNRGKAITAAWKMSFANGGVIRKCRRDGGCFLIIGGLTIVPVSGNI